MPSEANHVGWLAVNLSQSRICRFGCRWAAAASSLLWLVYSVFAASPTGQHVTRVRPIGQPQHSDHALSLGLGHHLIDRVVMETSS